MMQENKQRKTIAGKSFKKEKRQSKRETERER